MKRTLPLAALLTLIGLAVPPLEFWPRASADVPPLAMDFTFPHGVSYRTQPLIIEGQVGVTIKGQRGNRGVSRMVYRGPPCAGAIQFIGCTRCNLLDLEVVDESGCDATVLTTNAVDPANQGYSTACRFSNVRVLLSGNGKASKRAFSIDSYAAGGKDGNNDHHHFTDCLAQSYSECGFYVRGSQCHDLCFVRCQALDYGGRKPVGFHAADGVFFSWRDGGMNSNSIDFLLGTAEVRTAIDGHNSEHGQQFLVYPHASGLPHVNIQNVRFDGQPVAGKPVIDVAGGGPWSIRNSYFAGINGVCPTLRFAGTGIGSVDLSGVMLRQHGGTIPTVPLITVPASYDLRQFGLRYQHIDAADRRVDRKIVVNAAQGVSP